MSESLGILRLEGLVYFVHDASRSHQFYVERLDFAHVGNSSLDYEQSTGIHIKSIPSRKLSGNDSPNNNQGQQEFGGSLFTVIQMVLENWCFGLQTSKPHFVF